MIRTMGGFLNRLRANTAGNTLAIVGAALVPITAMIGSGLDVSRAYMAKSRMQSACDAASLAARRVMRNDNLSEEVVKTGEQFFNFNFSPGMYSTAAFEPEITKPEVGIVRVEASTRIPTTVMRLFGFDSLPLNVTCDASLNFVNTDVVLVLDVTGSMDETVGGTRKIVALQDAVMALYDELAPVQAQLESQGLRLRYGIAPYSSTVNVGHLLADESSGYIRNSTPYRSRVANYTTPEYVANPATSDGGAWEESNKTDDDCEDWVEASARNGGGPKPTATTRTTYQGSESNANFVKATNWSWSGASDTSGSSRSCRRWKTVETTTYTTRYKFTNWDYEQASFNTNGFGSGNTLSLATNTSGTVATRGKYNLQELAAANPGVSTTAVPWNGCIEERDTVNSINGGTSYTIPAGAFDLDINRIPDSESTRWRPMLPEAIFDSAQWVWCTKTNSRGQCTATASSVSLTDVPANLGYAACPFEARRLDEWTREDMEDYVGDLTPIGGTYHDIGMIWGARLISTGGVFADGCEEFNGMPCNRHIIFMTDGQQTAYCNVYTAYGLEKLDKRVGSSSSCPSTGELARHEQRFRMICNAAKNMNVSVWVIAFDTGLNANLTGCASNESQAQTSTNRDELITQFRQIGNQIGALRLTK